MRRVERRVRDEEGSCLGRRTSCQDSWVEFEGYCVGGRGERVAGI